MQRPPCPLCGGTKLDYLGDMFACLRFPITETGPYRYWQCRNCLRSFMAPFELRP